MPKNHSLDLFFRLINEKHKLIRERCDSLLKALAGENSDAKKSAAALLLQAANDLRSVLANSDIPSWLASALNELPLFLDGRWNSFDLLKSLIVFKSAADNHRWVFDESADIPFDFDSIFNHFKNESRLPELFDEIVRILDDIKNSGEVDSVTMLSALGKLISTIKRSKDGSYFSLNSSWEFLLSFLRNYLWGELSKLPVLGTALEALEKTIRETNEEMSRLHIQVKDEMTRVVGEEIKVLANRPAFPFVTYDKDGHLFNPSSIRHLPDATA